MSSAEGQPDSTQLAIDRTWLAHERTLMAWVRTATSMISFGFTIYKFFEYEQGRGAPVMHGLLTPRDFAMVMVSIGLVALVMATLAHRKEIHGLSAQLQGRRSMAAIVAGLVSVFGIAVLLSAIFRT